MSSLSAAIGTLFGLVTLTFVDQYLADAPTPLSCFCPPTGALAVVIFCMAKAPAAQPYNVVVSHLVSAAAAVAVHTFYEAIVPAAYAAALPVTHLALVAAALAMMQLGVLNPPAAAYAAVVAGKKMSIEAALTGPGVLGALVLVAASKVYGFGAAKVKTA